MFHPVRRKTSTGVYWLCSLRLTNNEAFVDEGMAHFLSYVNTGFVLRVFWGCYSFLAPALKKGSCRLMTKWILAVTFLNLVLGLLLYSALTYS